MKRWMGALVFTLSFVVGTAVEACSEVLQHAVFPAQQGTP